MSRRRFAAVTAALVLAGSAPVFLPAATAFAAPSAACSSYPGWVAGRWYNAGDIVRYTDGRAYIAEHANPGYDPIISTWYWEPYACDNGPGTPVGNFVVSEAQFNTMFPSRNAFYSYSALTSALKAATGRKGKALFHPLRLALTGRDSGPDMHALLPLIGEAEARARLERAAA